MRGERPRVGDRRDRLAGGLPGAMASPPVDLQDPRLIAELCGLERRDIFEAVGRHGAVVGISRRDQDRRIGRARADRVIGRIGQEIAEVGFLPLIAIIPDPELPACEAGEAQHAHDADARKGRGARLGVLPRMCHDILERPAVLRFATTFRIWGDYAARPCRTNLHAMKF